MCVFDEQTGPRIASPSLHIGSRGLACHTVSLHLHSGCKQLQEHRRVKIALSLWFRGTLSGVVGQDLWSSIVSNLHVCLSAGSFVPSRKGQLTQATTIWHHICIWISCQQQGRDFLTTALSRWGAEAYAGGCVSPNVLSS